MEQKKRRVSMSHRLNVLVIAIIFVLSGGLTFIAYRVNSERVDEYYKQTTANAAGVVSSFMDGDWLGGFLDTISSDEYQQLRAGAIEAEDEEIIRAYLTEHGWYEEYLRVCDTLSQYRDELGALYVYTVTLEGSDGFTIIDPDEDLFYIGTSIPVPPEFANIHELQRIEPTVSVTDYGWLCSAYDNVVNSKGKTVCQVGVDISMNDVIEERHQFLNQMITFALVLLVLSVGACVSLMHRIAIKPLVRLGDDARAISGGDFDHRAAGYANDEIGDLAGTFNEMAAALKQFISDLTRVTAEKERIGAELNVATQIQADMLPRIFPPFPDRTEFDIYATMTPAKEVGGDFYDFFLIDRDHLGLVMADVSGKGVPAALFMVIAKTLIKNRAQMGGGPAEILRYVNAQLCEGNEAELFVTVWLAIVELSTGKGLAANAGHEHPAIRRADGSWELAIYRHSPAVATMEGIRFREHSFELHPGDSLFVYTDGVAEATDASNELFGTDRMLAALNREPEAEPKRLLENVKAEIDSFVGAAPQFDDITMLGLHYFGPEVKNMKELTIRAEVDRLDEVLAFVDAELEAMDCPMKTQMQIDVAVEEIFVNIANYAYTPEIGDALIQLETDPEKRRVAVTFQDSGIPYDPLKKEDPDVTLSVEERKIGGLGVFMVKKSMDDVSYRHEGGKNILRLEKQI